VIEIGTLFDLGASLPSAMLPAGARTFASEKIAATQRRGIDGYVGSFRVVRRGPEFYDTFVRVEPVVWRAKCTAPVIMCSTARQLLRDANRASMKLSRAIEDFLFASSPSGDVCVCSTARHAACRALYESESARDAFEAHLRDHCCCCGASETGLIDADSCISVAVFAETL